MAWSITADKPAAAKVTLLGLNVQRIQLGPHALRPYREERVVAAARPASAPARGPRVSYRTGYLKQLQAAARPTPPKHAPSPKPKPSLAPTPETAPSASPEELAQDDSTPIDASPTPPQPAGTPSLPTPQATASPLAKALAADPNADFSLLLQYANDARLKRNAQGFLVLDLAELSRLPKVKPVLAEVPRRVLPLRAAGSLGLHPLQRVEAQVQVALDMPKGVLQLVRLVQPSQVVVTDVKVEGKAADGALRDQLVGFIRDQVASTQWLPASDLGNWQDHSEQIFEVQLVQTSASPTGAADRAWTQTATER